MISIYKKTTSDLADRREEIPNQIKLTAVAKRQKGIGGEGQARPLTATYPSSSPLASRPSARCSAGAHGATEPTFWSQ